MSRDRGTANQAIDQGYGVVCNVAGIPINDLIVSSANQEHGIVSRRDGGPINPSDYPVGMTLRVLPNHACATAAQYDDYKIVRGGQRVEAVWSRFRGW